MMPAIGTPVAANTSLGASLTLLPCLYLPRLEDIGHDYYDIRWHEESDTARYNCKTAPFNYLLLCDAIRIAREL